MDVQCVCIDNPYKENVMFMATVGLLNTISLYQPVELAQCSSEPPLQGAITLNFGQQISLVVIIVKKK